MSAIKDLKVQWSDASVQEELVKIDPDTLYLFQDSGVSQEIQAKLGYAGFSSVAKLRGLGDSRSDISSLLNTELEHDASASLAKRAAVAAVQAAWEASKIFVDKKVALDAEERIRGEPRPIKLTEFNRLKAAQEKVLGQGVKLPDEALPAPSLIEAIV